MKRSLQHIAFWGCYLLLCLNMEYLWVSKVLVDMDKIELWKSIVLSAGLTLIPEVLFAYYLMYIGYERLINKNVSPVYGVFEILLALITTVITIRYSTYQILAHWAYAGRLADEKLWDITIMWRSLIYIGFSCGFALSLRLFRNQSTIMQREKVLIEERLSVELKLLRNQLHPHFLFNTLNNIYALTRKKSDLAPEAVMKLSELLDFMLYKADSEKISLAKEIDFLEDYISLEKIRYNDRLDIKFNKEIANPDIEIIPLLLLPLVENAFKYGASETRFNSYIHITLKQENEIFNFTIANSFDSVENNENNGKLGLQNIRRRLELLYKEHRMDIVNKDNKFEVSLYLNLLTYGKT